MKPVAHTCMIRPGSAIRRGQANYHPLLWDRIELPPGVIRAQLAIPGVPFRLSLARRGTARCDLGRVFRFQSRTTTSARLGCNQYCKPNKSGRREDTMSKIEIERAAQQKSRRWFRAQAFELFAGAAVLLTVINYLGSAA